MKRQWRAAEDSENLRGLEVGRQRIPSNCSKKKRILLGVPHTCALHEGNGSFGECGRRGTAPSFASATESRGLSLALIVAATSDRGLLHPELARLLDDDAQPLESVCRTDSRIDRG